MRVSDAVLPCLPAEKGQPCRMFAGALFDWDGVIVDSHRQHEMAWEALATELGQPLPPGFFKATFGMRNDRIIPEFSGWVPDGDPQRIAELGDRKEALYREVIRRDGIEPLPGVSSMQRTSFLPRPSSGSTHNSPRTRRKRPTRSW